MGILWAMNDLLVISLLWEFGFGLTGAPLLSRIPVSRAQSVLRSTDNDYDDFYRDFPLARHHASCLFDRLNSSLGYVLAFYVWVN